MLIFWMVIFGVFFKIRDNWQVWDLTVRVQHAPQGWALVCGEVFDDLCGSEHFSIMISVGECVPGQHPNGIANKLTGLNLQDGLVSAPLVSFMGSMTLWNISLM